MIRISILYYYVLQIYYILSHGFVDASGCEKHHHPENVILWNRVDHWLGRTDDGLMETVENEYWNFDREDVSASQLHRGDSFKSICDDLKFYGMPISNPIDDNWMDNDDVSGSSATRMKKTGTTIVGIVSPDGRTCVLAADTRATESSSLIADKRVCKVHDLSSNIWACGAGTSGDIDALLRKIKYSSLLLQQQQQQEEESVSLITILSSIRKELYKYSHENSSGNALGVNLIVAGFHDSKFQLVALHPHGSMDVNIPFVALGSGSLPAMSVLESSSSLLIEDSTIEEIAIRAVRAGMENDLASGNSIHLLTMKLGDSNNNKNQPKISLKHIVSQTDTPQRISIEQKLSPNHGDSKTRLGVNGFGSLSTPMIRQKRMIRQAKEAVQQKHSNWFQEQIQKD